MSERRWNGAASTDSEGIYCWTEIEVKSGKMITKQMFCLHFSFNKTGIKIISGQYEKGKKVGRWIFRNNGKIKEVEYSDNTIVDVVNWDTPVTLGTVND